MKKTLRKKVERPTIDEEALRSDSRIVELYNGAVSSGILSASEADKINYFSAAEYALANSETPGDLFAWMVKGRHFDRITDEDEAIALQRLRRLAGVIGAPRARVSDEDATWEMQRKLHQRILDYRRSGVARPAAPEGTRDSGDLGAILSKQVRRHGRA
jgi:hypothetical protein